MKRITAVERMYDDQVRQIASGQIQKEFRRIRIQRGFLVLMASLELVVIVIMTIIGGKI